MNDKGKRVFYRVTIFIMGMMVWVQVLMAGTCMFMRCLVPVLMRNEAVCQEYPIGGEQKKEGNKSFHASYKDRG